MVPVHNFHDYTDDDDDDDDDFDDSNNRIKDTVYSCLIMAQATSL